ncbi:DUF2382 domain-containing protein [Rothia halotolerans]|uniref:DUF2382 domain-containing protein n=1 Tax=Rothia halotolerans TaxID=405770 RepID=UPI00101BBD07|nr:PRC and DUF2382 domain-containing protein [Rothia halotolerans]
MVDQEYDFQALENATVFDSEHSKIGTVGQVYLDDETGEPTFVTVNMGLFGTRETFVPVDATQRLDEGLIIPFSKAYIKDAPAIDADQHITPEEEREVVRYYANGGAEDRPRSGRGGDQMVAHEERLNVGTRQQEAGRAHLRKRVRTQTEQIEVPVRHEELVVERERIDPGSPEARSDAPIREAADDEEVITLRKERPVVEKETVATEKVNVGKRTVQDSKSVSAEVRKEEIDVEDDGDASSAAGR